VGRSVAVNTDGEAYVAGLTPFDSFPDTACPDLLVLAPSDPPGDPTDDVFVIKVNPGGTALPSCALLGGAASESLGEMVLDPFGGVYVAGFTPSEDFPTTEEAFQRTGSLDAFVLKLNDTTAAMTRRMQFASATYRVLEGEGQAVITVNRTGDLAEPSSVYFRTTDGSARDGADYQHREHRLTFGAGESALAVTVPVIGDTEAEKDETVNLTLSDPQGGELGFRAQAVLTIGEDDGLTRSITISDRAIPNGPPSWRVLEEMPWLSVNIPSGSGPATLTVTADPRFLAPGTYTGTIIVEADAEDSPQFVHVTFRVLE
jgi:hypothetical protein